MSTPRGPNIPAMAPTPGENPALLFNSNTLFQKINTYHIVILVLAVLFTIIAVLLAFNIAYSPVEVENGSGGDVLGGAASAGTPNENTNSNNTRDKLGMAVAAIGMVISFFFAVRYNKVNATLRP